MQYKNTIEAVYIHLDEIQQLVAKFGAEGEGRTIDIDLTLDKLRDVYDLVLSLRSESGTKTTPIREEISEQPETISVPASPGVNAITKTDVSEDNFFEPPLNSTKDEKEMEEEQHDSEIEEIPEKKEETQAEKHSRVRSAVEKRYLGESLQQEKTIINEELSQNKSTTDISARLKTKPITSITAAIGLNEKFELIHNLFNDNKVKYEHTMVILNSATNFNDAYDYLSANFDWDMNDPLVQRILELIRRKLIVRKNEQ